MRITQETDYAFRIVSHLARHENEVIGAPKIAESEKVTERFTLRILRKLNLAGITGAKRGARGGYYLKKPKEEVSIYDIVVAVDGPIEINRCLSSEDKYCNRYNAEGIKHCNFHNTLCEFQNELIDLFKSKTMDQFV
ncbi:Rrf2 family protein [Peptoniphilus olsenii]|uniref:Rrf2 family protein n=1 Tax=Peptoniphilus olsenii TaxID=411570 RepID=A0ABV2J9G8_9FIRM